MESPFRIRRLSGPEAVQAVPALAEVMLDCVAAGASVSFMADLSVERAQAFWRKAAEAVAQDGRAILVAEDSRGIFGVVQVIPAQIDNQPHRADVAKMLVHRRGRRQGAAEALMRGVETAARELGKTLLTLDTVTGSDAERLYTRLGWSRVGVIPNYALFPDGRPCATTVFYKQL